MYARSRTFTMFHFTDRDKLDELIIIVGGNGSTKFHIPTHDMLFFHRDVVKPITLTFSKTFYDIIYLFLASSRTGGRQLMWRKPTHGPFVEECALPNPDWLVSSKPFPRQLSNLTSWGLSEWFDVEKCNSRPYFSTNVSPNLLNICQHARSAFWVGREACHRGERLEKPAEQNAHHAVLPAVVPADENK